MTGEKGDTKNKKPYLDPTSSFPPPGVDPTRILEQVAARSAARKEARASLPAGSFSFEPPESAASLTHTHRLVALLFACGADASDIGLELGGTAEEIDRLERNLLIEEQTRAYRDRFWSKDSSAQFKGLAPSALKIIEGALRGDGTLTKAQLESAYWTLEKATGKAAQQVNVTDTTSLSHFMDEMKRMRESQESQTLGFGPTARGPDGSVIDVTPQKAPEPERPYRQYMLDWKKKNEAEK